MSVVVLNEEEVSDHSRAKAEAVLATLLGDPACALVAEEFPRGLSITWYGSEDGARKADINPAGRIAQNIPPDLKGFVSKSGRLFLNAAQPLDELPATISRLVGQLGRQLADSDPVAQRAVIGWQPSTKAEIESSGEYLERRFAERFRYG